MLSRGAAGEQVGVRAIRANAARQITPKQKRPPAFRQRPTTCSENIVVVFDLQRFALCFAQAANRKYKSPV